MEEPGTQTLLDFLVWLGKEKIVETQRMPSGKTLYGKGLHDGEDLFGRYWGTYQ